MKAGDFFQSTALFCLGILVSFIAVYLFGYTTALAMPVGFLAFFGSLSLFVWDLVAVNFLGIGLIAFVAAWLIFRTVKRPRPLHGLVTILGILFGAYIAVPLLHGLPLHFSVLRPWSGYGFEICILLAFLAAWSLSGRRA